MVGGMQQGSFSMQFAAENYFRSSQSRKNANPVDVNRSYFVARSLARSLASHQFNFDGDDNSIKESRNFVDICKRSLRHFNYHTLDWRGPMTRNRRFGCVRRERWKLLM